MTESNTLETVPQKKKKKDSENFLVGLLILLSLL